MTHPYHCPKRPTVGHMRTLLERHGIRARGIYKDGVKAHEAEMIRQLRELGYDITPLNKRGAGSKDESSGR